MESGTPNPNLFMQQNRTPPLRKPTQVRNLSVKIIKQTRFDRQAEYPLQPPAKALACRYAE